MWWSLKDIVVDRLGPDLKSFVRSTDGPLNEVIHLAGTRYQEVVDSVCKGTLSSMRKVERSACKDCS